MNVKKITYRNKLYSLYFNALKADKGLNFATEDEHFIQVGVWNYDKNLILQAHYHNEYSRVASRTSESIYIVEGKIKCSIFTKNGNFIDSYILQKNDVAIQFYGVHEYEILEKSLVIETKNGPYYGPKKDRKRVNVRKKN